MRRAAGCACAALALLLGAGAAPAQAPRTEAVVDARGDVKGRLDLRRVALGLRRGHRTVRAEITLRRSWGTADLRSTDGPPGSLCMRMWAKRDHESQVPDYLACATPAPDSERLVGQVLRDRPNALPTKVYEAKTSRPSGRTVYIRWPRRVFKRAFGVHFSGEAVRRGRGCPGPAGCRDLAPDAPNAMFLRLSD